MQFMFKQIWVLFCFIFPSTASHQVLSVFWKGQLTEHLCSMLSTVLSTMFSLALKPKYGVSRLHHLTSAALAYPVSSLVSKWVSLSLFPYQVIYFYLYFHAFFTFSLIIPFSLKKRICVSFMEKQKQTKESTLCVSWGKHRPGTGENFE